MATQTSAGRFSVADYLAAAVLASALLVAPNAGALSIPGPVLHAALYVAVLLTLLVSIRLRDAWLAQFWRLSPAARWAVGLVPLAGVAAALIAGGPLAERLGAVASLAGLPGVALLTTCVLARLGRHANAFMLSVWSGAAGLYVMSALARYSAGAADGSTPDVAALFSGGTRDYLAFSCWALPIVAVMPALLPARRLRYLPHIVTSTLWTLVFFSVAAGALAALAVALAAVPLVMGRAGWRWLRLQGISAIVGFAFYTGGYRLLDGVSSPFGWHSIVASWTDALRTIKHNYLVGAGPGHYGLAPAASAPDNAWLQLAAEWGLPAALATAGVLVGGLTAWLRNTPARYRKRQDADALTVAGLTGAAMASLLYSLFAGTLTTTTGPLYLAVAAGWMAYIYGRRAGEPPMRQPLRRHLVLTVSATLIALGSVNALVQAV